MFFFRFLENVKTVTTDLHQFSFRVSGLGVSKTLSFKLHSAALCSGAGLRIRSFFGQEGGTENININRLYR